MQPVTPASSVTCVPTPVPTDSPDAALHALLPALKAAVRERRQFGDRNTDGHPGARPYEETIERRASLHRAVDAAAARMLALRPRTLTGLLLTAHASAATTDWLWDDGVKDRAPAERILRTLCDNLFALFGVDRHGRYIVAPFTPEPDPATETAILRMLTDAPAEMPAPVVPAAHPKLVALVEAWQAAERKLQSPALREEQVTALGCEATSLQRAIYAFPARSLADLCAKLPALRDEAGATTNTTLDASCLRGLVADLERLSTGSEADAPSGCGPDPVTVEAATGADADLLALGQDFDAAFAAYLAVRPRELAAEEARDTAYAEEPGLTQEALAQDAAARALYAELCGPFEATMQEAQHLRERADRPAEAAFRLPPPRTLAGLAVLARMLAGFHAELWDGAPAELEIDERMLRTTLEATLALAGVDRLGRPLAQAAPDPVLAAIEAHRKALDFQNNLPEGSTDEDGDKAFDAWSDAFDAMGSEPPATIAGLHALAGHLRWYLGDTGEEVDGPAKWVLDLLLGVVERFDAPPAAANGTLSRSSTPASADPVLAAIEASRRANREHEAAVVAPDTATPAGAARADAACDAAYRAWQTLLATPPLSVAGAQALARHAADHIASGGVFDDTGAQAVTLFRAIGMAGGPDGGAPLAAVSVAASRATGEAPGIGVDPAFPAAAAHRTAHIAWLAALEGDDEVASGAALDRKNEAFRALLGTRPRTEAGALASARHVLFEFAHIAIGSTIPVELARQAGRLANRGFPVRSDSVPRDAIEPTAAAAALDTAIHAHMMAYAHRLHSAVAGEPDAVERAEQEREAFRTLLHMPLGSDAARTSYATAVIGRAAGHHGDECVGEGRGAPMPVAYRNLAYGEYAPEAEAPMPMAAQ